MRTHYDNLQVARNAGPEVIRGAFRQLSQKWHPDKNPDNHAEAERVSRIINQAYEVLSDPERRREHDRWIATQEARAAEPAPAAGERTLRFQEARLPGQALLLFDQPYHPKPLEPLLTMAIFGLVAWAAWTALLGDAAPHGAAWLARLLLESKGFLVTVAALSLLAAVLGFALLVLALTSPHRVLLTREALLAPPHVFSRQIRVLPLPSVQALSLHRRGRSGYLRIRHAQGRLTIASALLPGTVQLDALCSLLAMTCACPLEAGGAASTRAWWNPRTWTRPRAAAPPPIGARGLFSFRGRAGRLQFWNWVVFALMLGGVALFWTARLAPAGHGRETVVTAAVVVGALLGWPTLAVSARRWHDTGRSGAWSLLWLLPLLGWVACLAFNGLRRGDAGANRFGPPP